MFQVKSSPVSKVNASIFLSRPRPARTPGGGVGEGGGGGLSEG